MNKKPILIFIVFTFFCLYSIGQIITLPPITTSRNIPALNYSASRIYGNGLDVFYKKLYDLQKEHKGVVRVVHIGDSHIQADFLSGVVRNGLQDAFGNAGRGLIFAYQVARTNAPSDIKSNSNTVWHSSRLVRKDLPFQCGISGFCIECSRPGATINVQLQDNDKGQVQFFKHLKIFIDDNSSWLLRTDSSNIIQLKKDAGDSTQFYNVLLENPVTGFTLTSQSTGSTQAFYGAIAETDLSGVLYSSIGVNGARYDQYNSTPLFWKQLPALQADLYIISMGTNEAQGAGFDEAGFSNAVTTFISKLKIASPGATVLITTAMDSYRAGRPNKTLQQLNDFLYRYTSRENIPLWDMYRVTLGYSASRNWIRMGLMAKDKIHFTKDGYELQGGLLLNVLLKSYNDYYTKHL